jgi:hypothetical protein
MLNVIHAECRYPECRGAKRRARTIKLFKVEINFVGERDSERKSLLRGSVTFAQLANLT